MEFVILPILLFTSFVALAIGMAVYLLFAFGLYGMAKTLDLPSPWMAFVPVVSNYLLGLVAEKDSAGRSTHKYSWILLIFQIAAFFSAAAYYIVLAATYATGLIAAFGVFALIHGAVSIASCVFYYIALYRVYKLFDSDNAPIFIILSIFFSISVPILFFILRNRQPQINYGNPFEHTNNEE